MAAAAAHLDAWAFVADSIDPPANPYLDDPVRWARERVGRELWSKQREILESVRDNPRTAVHSCHGAGKSNVAATAAGWWIDAHLHGEARVATSAPSTHQVEAILWYEIHRLADDIKQHSDGPLPGRLNLTSWFYRQKEIAFGRKPADQDVLDQFQGVHAAEGVLVILDEAGGIPAELWEAAAKITTSPKDRMLVIGNPDYEGSPFSKVCSDPTWNVIHIDGLETPNFTREDVPPGAQLISQEFIDRVVHDYGIDSPQYVGQVRGRFPKDRTDGIIPWPWIDECRGPLATEKIGPLRVPVHIGVDVAGTEDGGDETVIWPRFGSRAGDSRNIEDGGDVRRMRTEDSEKIVDAVMAMIADIHATEVKVDWGGMGFGVFGSLRRRVRESRSVTWPVEIHDVKFGAGAADPKRFKNVRAELWWTGRELSRAGAWDLSAVADDVIGELVEARWFETRTNSRVQVEEKKEIRRRLGRSPDNADALLLAYYEPARPAVATAVTVHDRRLSGRRSR